MNRKLHNTLSALLASGALLVVGLIVAAPAVPTPGDELAGTSALAAALETAASGIEDATENASSRSTRTNAPNQRQILVMPYFSFVPRG